jgi:hypothetical protein
MRLAVLIATKNRPVQLNTLLCSLQQSKNRINQVIIVSSGSEVSEIIESYRYSLNIIHSHSKVSGQIYQKIEGLKLLDKHIDWVLFLDDDLTISKVAIDDLIDGYLHNPKYKDVGGFGLNLSNIELRSHSYFSNYVLKLIGFKSQKPGTILKSGHAQKYLDSKNDIYTQWLNGLSVWRSELLHHYKYNFSRVDYAAYEDVIFSYRASREMRLMFASRIYAENQGLEKFKPLITSQFKAGAYMRFLFVVENNEFSKISMLISQLFRTLDFTINGDPAHSVFYRAVYSFNILVDLIKASIINKNPVALLVEKYN